METTEWLTEQDIDSSAKLIKLEQSLLVGENSYILINNTNSLEHTNAFEYVRSQTTVDVSVVCQKKGFSGFFQKQAQKGLFSRFFRGRAEKGLFDTVGMPAGHFVGEYTGTTIITKDPRNLPNEIELSHVLWKNTPDSESNLWIGRFSKIGLAFANHSRTDPNMVVEPGTYKFYKIKDTSIGDELTFSYGNFDF